VETYGPTGPARALETALRTTTRAVMELVKRMLFNVYVVFWEMRKCRKDRMKFDYQMCCCRKSQTLSKKRNSTAVWKKKKETRKERVRERKW